MTTIILVRHGTYTDMENGAYIVDPGLSPEGVAQVERLRDRLLRTGEIKADRLITSTMRRAQETANILAPALNVPVTPEKSLVEWYTDDGSLSPEEFNARWEHVSEAQRPYYRWVESTEPWLNFTTRIYSTLNQIIQKYEGETVVIVTHGEVIQAAFGYFLGLGGTTMPSIYAENTSLTRWTRKDPTRKWTLIASNDCAHLAPPA